MNDSVMASQELGVLVGGSLTRGLSARLNDPEQIERVHVGQYVVIRGNQARYLALITDVSLKTTDEQLIANPPSDAFTRRILAGTATYATIELLPTMSLVPSSQGIGLQPVRAVPQHFSSVEQAGDEDFDTVFGREDSEHYFIGQPLDNTQHICIDLRRMTERSNGVFGKTGTGKSFLTRLLIAGTIKHHICANLIFDMHGEYGWQATKEDRGQKSTVRSLKDLFPDQVIVFTLDPASAQRRQVSPDGSIVLTLKDITEDDILLLSHELGLKESAAVVISAFRRHYKAHWLSTLISLDDRDIGVRSEEVGANASSTRALVQRLRRLVKRPFIMADILPDDSASPDWEEFGETNTLRERGGSESSSLSVIKPIVSAIEQGKHVVIDFGASNDVLSYLLVTNVIVRNLRKYYVERTEKQLAGGGISTLRPLMITIEEAHRFLEPDISQSTVFGELAREMRKYNLTLLIVDQRPSKIDDEIMSQLGTRFICLLDDDRDIHAALSGVSGSARLQMVLASLETRGQALLIGHALPMPIAIRTRLYDENFYRDMRGGLGETELRQQADVRMQAFRRSFPT